MNIIQSTLFAILRSALGIRKIASPVSLTARQWKMLFAAALQQQVAALVLDELNSFGSNIPNDIKSQWQKYSNFSALYRAAKNIGTQRAIIHIGCVSESPL